MCIRQAILIFLALFLHTATGEEYGYFTRATTEDPWNKVVTLREGDRLVFLTSNSSDWGVQLTIPNGNAVFLDADSLGFALHTDEPAELIEKRTIVGPCDVSAASTSARYISYKIVRASDGSIQPTNVISLPANHEGDMQIIVETSTNLTEWPVVYTFSHNSTNQASRFFRTRITQGSD